MKPKLTVELVPASCWYTNVRSEVSSAEWDKIRRAVYKAAGHRCEVCGGRGAPHPVECHEIWRYDDENLVQHLDGMIALCPMCHQVKHLGLAFTRGRGEIAIAWLAKVNGWTSEQAESYAEEAFAVWEERSEFPWTLDLVALNKYLGP